jgi:hypothetical protein
MITAWNKNKECNEYEIVNGIRIVDKNATHVVINDVSCDLSRCLDLKFCKIYDISTSTIILPETIEILELRCDITIQSKVKHLIVDRLITSGFNNVKALTFSKYVEKFTIPPNLIRLIFCAGCSYLYRGKICNLKYLEGEISNMPPVLENLEKIKFHSGNIKCKVPNLKEVDVEDNIRLYPAKIKVTIRDFDLKYKRSKNTYSGGFGSVKDISYNMFNHITTYNKFINIIIDNIKH